MKFISYAIPVCNEHEELSRLLTFLQTHKKEIDEIVVQCDEGNTTQEVWNVLQEHLNTIKVVHYPLRGDFASFKNNLKAHCEGQWIFQIDADEMLSEWFMENIHEILINNPTVELLCVPRINTVDGLTQEHIQNWGWNVNENGWVNFPDVQTRILQNSPKIKWIGKVHEVIYGHSSHAVLPIVEEYCILHHKNIRRQEMQNALYNTIQ
jgi:hypothetical protein